MLKSQFNRQNHEANLVHNLDFKKIYFTCFPVIRNMVLRNNGTIEDAEDIFQESILVLFQNSQKSAFQLSASSCTYLYSIARNKWLQLLRDQAGRNMEEIDEEDISMPDEINDDPEKEKQRLFMKHFGRLGGQCQELLKRFFEGDQGESISESLGFSSYQYYRVAKSRCIDQLKRTIKADPVFPRLGKENNL